jgi:hypothetical protein
VYSQVLADTAATAYLTTQTGTGATSATLVAQAGVTLPVGTAGSTPELQLFSGLTLPPGTYYLILATTDTSGNEGWLNGCHLQRARLHKRGRGRCFRLSARYDIFRLVRAWTRIRGHG